MSNTLFHQALEIVWGFPWWAKALAFLPFFALAMWNPMYGWAALVIYLVLFTILTFLTWGAFLVLLGPPIALQLLGTILGSAGWLIRRLVA